MKLTRLQVHRMPGVRDLHLDHVGPGLNIVAGPNGAGKTSAMRAVRVMLWPGSVPLDVIDAVATWRHGDLTLRSSCQGPGRVRWQRDGRPWEGPSLPDDRFAGCFFPSLPLLLVPAGSDAGLGREIARQLAGGYDLEALLASGRFGPMGRPGQGEARALARAERELRDLQARSAALAGRQEGLAARRERLEAAVQAREREALLERALARLGALESVEAAEGRLSSFPSFMAALRGDEMNRLRTLEGEARAARDEAVEAGIRARRLQGELDALGPLEPPDPPALRALREEGERARELERTMDVLSHRIEAVDERLRRALARLGGELPPSGAHLPALDALQQLLQARQELLERRCRLEAEAEALGRVPEPTGEPHREAAQALRDWLAAPSASRGRRLVAAVIALALTLTAVAALAGLFSSPRFLVAIPLGVGLALVALWPERPAAVTRRASVRRFQATGQPLPAGWTVHHVGRRLAEMDLAVARSTEARVRAERRAPVEAALAAVAIEEERHRERVLDARRRLGLPAQMELSLVAAGELLRQALEARAQRASLERERRALAETMERVLGLLRSRLVPYGEEPESPAVALSALAELEHVGHERRRIEGLLGEVRQREAAATSLAKRRAAEAAELLATIGVGAHGELAGALERLPEWMDAARARDEARTILGEHERALKDNPDLLEAGEGALEAALRAAREAASEEEHLRAEITRAEAEISLVMGRDDLERALVARDEARAALASRRAEAMAGAAGRFLLRQAAARHEEEARPRVLRRAMRLFELFTHHGQALTVARDGAIGALDVGTGQGRGLHELSDGTRTQLLLAVGLAFAMESERGTKVPLVLDEALGVSDPARFQAVLECLLALVRDEDRQIFYLTSQPVDVAAWRGAWGADLALTLLEPGRGAAPSGRTAGPAMTPPRPPEPPPPPEPGEPPGDYGVRLGLPPFRPARGASAQHPLYVLPHDTAALHRMMRLRLETVGAVRSFLASSASGDFEEESRSGVLGRARALEVFTQAWSEGRGAPVGRQEIIRGGLGEAFIEPACRLAEELGGDGAALVEALKDGRVPRLRRTKIVELERWLDANGFLDLRPILPRSVVLARVLALGAQPGLERQGLSDLAAWWWSMTDP